MTGLPISHLQSATSTRKIAAAFVRLIALFKSALSALGHATTLHVRGRAMRRTPEEILMAQARCEDARRAVDRLLR